MTLAHVGSGRRWWTAQTSAAGPAGPRMGLGALAATVTLASLAWAGPAGAQSPPAGTPDDPGRDTAAVTVSTPAARSREGSLTLTLAPLVEHTFETDLDEGPGDFSVTRGGLNFGVAGMATPSLRLALDGEFEASYYRFRNATGLFPGTDRPFNDVYQLQLTPTATYIIDRQWSVTGGGFVTFAGEGEADVGESITGGGLALASYSFSEDFTLSFGVLATSRLEDDALVLPIIGVRWKITPTVRLETRGLGVVVTADLSEAWAVTLDGGFESREYRLADESPLPEGVVRDRRAPVAVGVIYKPAPWVELTLRGGATVWQEFEIDNAAGDEVAEVESDPAPFVSFRATLRF